MNDQMPPCFGMAWDEPSVPECVSCSVHHKCKDKFSTITLYEVMKSNPQIQDSELCTNFGVSNEALNEAKATLAEVLQGNTSSTVSRIPATNTNNDNVERPVPFKKRRGRKPPNLVVCDKCSGKGWVDNGICPKCQGYGDYNFQDQTNTNQGQTTLDTGAEKQSITQQISSGDSNNKNMEGQAIPCQNTQMGLPLQQQTLSNTIFNSTGNSRGETTPQANQRRETPQRQEENSGLVGSKIFQVEQVISGLGRISRFFVEDDGGLEISIKLY